MWGDGGGGHVAYRPGPLIFDNQTRASAELSDEEASQLWPPKTRREAARPRQARDVAAAGRIEDLDTEQLHALLFGDTTGDTT